LYLRPVAVVTHSPAASAAAAGLPVEVAATLSAPAASAASTARRPTASPAGAAIRTVGRLAVAAAAAVRRGAANGRAAVPGTKAAMVLEEVECGALLSYTLRGAERSEAGRSGGRGGRDEDYCTCRDGSHREGGGLVL